MRRLSNEQQEQLRGAHDLYTCKELRDGSIRLVKFPYVTLENHNIAAPTNYQQLQKSKMLVLPDCCCLIPSVITMKHKSRIPDIDAWKERARNNPGREVAPVYTAEAEGKRTLLVCGRGPTAVASGEHCGFRIDVTFVYAYHKVTGYDLLTKSAKDMPKYGIGEMGWLKDRSEAHRDDRWKTLNAGKSKAEKLEERLLSMGKRSRYNPSTDLGPRGGLRSPDAPRRFIFPDTPSPSPPPSRQPDDEDPTLFFCPHCKNNISIMIISEHLARCRPSATQMARGSVLTRRPLMGTSTVIPTTLPTYGGSYGAGPGPTTLANYRRESPGGEPPPKRRRVEGPDTSSSAPAGIIELIDLSSEDETQPPPQPPHLPVQFFADRLNSPPSGRRVVRSTPPPPYSG